MATQEWNPFLLGNIRVAKAIPDSLSGGVIASYGTVELLNPWGPGIQAYDLDADFGLGGYTTAGQSVRLWLGGNPRDTGYFSRDLVHTGRMEKATRSAGRITIPIKDEIFLLKKKTSHSSITAALYPNAPDESLEQVIPIHLGLVKNFQPLLVDPGTLLYLVGKCSQVLQAFDNGYPVGFQVPPVVEGGYQLIQLMAPPVGVVTCDILGTRVSATYPNQSPTRLGDVLLDLAQAAGVPINTTASTQFIETYPYDVGFVVRQPTEYRELMDQLMSGILGFYDVFPDGWYRLGVVAAPVGGAVAKFEGYNEIVGPDWTLTETDPVYASTLTYNNNETVLSNIAAAVSLARKEFLKKFSSSVTRKDASILTTYPHALDEGTIATRLVNRADAIALANLRVNFRKVPRYVFRGRFPLTAYKVQLSDNVIFNYAGSAADPIAQRYGMTTDRLWMVKRKEMTLTPGEGSPSTITLELLR